VRDPKIPSRWEQDPESGSIFRAVMGTAPAENYAPIARWDRLRLICGNQFASGGRVFIREAGFCCIHAGFEVHKHGSQMRVEPKHCKNERSTAAAEVGNHLRAGKIPRFGVRTAVC
jgi:hypothetical protein